MKLFKVIFCSLRNKLWWWYETFDNLLKVKNAFHYAFSHIIQNFCPTPFIFLELWQIRPLVSDDMQKSTQHSSNKLYSSCRSLDFAELIHQTVVNLIDDIEGCWIEWSSSSTTNLWLSRLIIPDLEFRGCKFRIATL